MALLSWGNKKPDNKHDVCFSYQQACIKKKIIEVLKYDCIDLIQS